MSYCITWLCTVRHCLVLCACKLLLMPALYLAAAPLLGCPADPGFLQFLATMPGV